MSRRKTTLVYLLHFHQRFRHAQHYLGSCIDLQARLAEHEHGQGSRYMAAVVAAGITWELAATFKPKPEQTGHALERYMKGSPRGNGHKGSLARYCPICKAQKKQEQEA